MSFNKRPMASTYKNEKFMTEYQACYNTFNKSNYSSFRDRMNINNLQHSLNNNNYRSNSYNSFYKSSAPFYCANNMNNKGSLFVHYNGGPKRQFRSILPKENWSQFGNNRSSSFKFKRPCGCYSKYNISKYIQCWDYPYNDRVQQYNNNYQMNELPPIDGENMRYSNGFNTAQIGNNGKLTYKLKNTGDDAKCMATDSNYENNKKEEIEKKNDENNQNNNEKEEKEEKKENKEKKYEFKNRFYYFNTKPRRRFHKVQIFNNYKPFLVDDFKDYGDYE